MYGFGESVILIYLPTTTWFMLKRIIWGLFLHKNLEEQRETSAYSSVVHGPVRASPASVLDTQNFELHLLNQKYAF